MTDLPPPVQIETTKTSWRSRFSIVWIIPVLALIIALAVAWQSYSSRGPLIEIAFENGAGVSAGQTELRFRDVTVGKVEKVKFSKSLDQVLVEVRLDKDIAPFVDESAQFWVVRPEVTTQGISGLDTVLSGVFIEGSWDGKAGGATNGFKGLNEVPLIRPGQGGLQITLRSGPGTALNDNSPILFRGIEVGRIGQARIAANGSFAVAEAIIFDKHRNLLSENTRFWDVSGFEFSVGPGGAEVDFKSVAALLAGGLTFDTIISGGDPVQDGYVFEVFSGEAKARSSVFNASDVETLDMTVIFADNIAGLAVGAPVELKGLKIGEITNLTGVVDRTIFGDSRVRLNASIAIQPARLGLATDATPQNALKFFREQVQDGLRARLASASILTGGLKVELLKDPNATTAMIIAGNPFPIMPVTESAISDVGATAEGVFTRINNLPIEELMTSIIDVMKSTNALISDDALRETPQQVSDLIGDVRGLVGAPEIQAIPSQIGDTLAQINGAITQMEAVFAQVVTEQTIRKLGETLQAASATASGVDTAIAGVPDLITRIEAVAAKAEALDVEAVLGNANTLVTSANTLVTNDDLTALIADVRSLVGASETQQIPVRLNATLAQIETLLVDIETQQVVTNLTSALDAAAKAANSADTAVAGIPALIEKFDALAVKADGMNIEGLVQSASDVLQAAEQLIGSDDTAKLPASLSAALDEVRITLAELRAGGAIENTNRALASVGNAADAVAKSTESLPALVARLNAVLGQATTTLQSYDGTSEVNRSARDAMRDIQKAADAITALARTIQRNPNSLLLGR